MMDFIGLERTIRKYCLIMRIIVSSAFATALSYFEMDKTINKQNNMRVLGHLVGSVYASNQITYSLQEKYFLPFILVPIENIN